eukprot:4087295-Pyramimonas_sp.AAC.1
MRSQPTSTRSLAHDPGPRRHCPQATTAGSGALRIPAPAPLAVSMQGSGGPKPRAIQIVLG